ncbi:MULTISPECIES: hypothetical protein [Bacillus]|uniref:hypothetical protein n=1 Tax=Bacillus TaxID=1386 RepID=UPI000301947B|nr:MULTISPECIES: hypothetical protein [Bacillus]
MPYRKDNQYAFQEAQEKTKEVSDVLEKMDSTDAAYGQQLKHLKQEIEVAYQQIENALEIASEHQRKQLEQYQQFLHDIVSDLQES